MKFKTKWGHEFNTKAELSAFKKGLEYMKGNLDVLCEQIVEQVDIDNLPDLKEVDWFYLVCDKKTKKSNIDDLKDVLIHIEWSYYKKCGEDKKGKLLIKIADEEDNALIMVRCHNQIAYLELLDLLNNWDIENENND